MTPQQRYQPWWHRLPMSIIISVTFFVGAYRVSASENGLDGYVLLTVAVLLVGIWITIELHDKFYGEHRQDLRNIVREELSEGDE